MKIVKLAKLILLTALLIACAVEQKEPPGYTESELIYSRLQGEVSAQLTQ